MDFENYKTLVDKLTTAIEEKSCCTDEYLIKFVKFIEEKKLSRPVKYTFYNYRNGKNEDVLYSIVDSVKHLFEFTKRTSGWTTKLKASLLSHGMIYFKVKGEISINERNKITIKI